MATGQYVNVHIKHQNDEYTTCDLNRAIVAGATLGGLSISETGLHSGQFIQFRITFSLTWDVLGFSHTTVLRVYTDRCEQKLPGDNTLTSVFESYLDFS